MSTPVTMRDIARRLGVSQPVVSKALYGGRSSVRVSPVVAAQVRAAAVELGYRPNAAARVLTRRRFASVTLVQYAYRNWSYLPQELLEAINDGLAERALGLAVRRCTQAEMSNDDAPPRLLSESDADGLIINLNRELETPLRARFSDLGVPAVWLNADHGADSVIPDDRDAARRLTETLLNAGERRIRYLGLGIDPQENHASKAERPAGYAEAMRAAGLPATTLLVADAAEARARLDDPAGCWVTYSDAEACLLLALAAEAGLRAGRDLRLALFVRPYDPIAMLAASVAVEPLAAVGAAAVEMLVAKITEPATSLPVRRIPWRITTQGTLP